MSLPTCTYVQCTPQTYSDNRDTLQSTILLLEPDNHNLCGRRVLHLQTYVVSRDSNLVVEKLNLVR